MSKMKIAIVDYGMGNLRSVTHALRLTASETAEVILTADPDQVYAADKVVFPGQGAMPDCMTELNASGLREAVIDAAWHKPFLGICVGAQLLLEFSEEGGNVHALGFYPGDVKRLPLGQKIDISGKKLKVPHMGWNNVYQRQSHPLYKGVKDGARFYFVHSYYMDPTDNELILGETAYPFGFASVIGKDNVFATQFHPEKSASDGLTLLENFIHWDGQGL